MVVSVIWRIDLLFPLAASRDRAKARQMRTLAFGLATCRNGETTKAVVTR